MPQVTLIRFRGGVPKVSIHPGNPSHKTIGLDGAKNRTTFRINLVDLPAPVISHPKRSLGPRQPGVTPAAGRRNGGQNLAGLGIDLLDAILGNLKQVPAVEGSSRMRGDMNGAPYLTTPGIEGVQLVS